MSLEHDNIFVDSAMFRFDFTYFVKYQIQRLPDDYSEDYIKPPFHVEMQRIPHRETMMSQFTLMDENREHRETYKDAKPERMSSYTKVKDRKMGGSNAMHAMRESVDILEQL